MRAKKEEIPENKFLKLTYSSDLNISFHNRKCPDYLPLPEHWDELKQHEKLDLMEDMIAEYVWSLVHIDEEIVQFKEGMME